MGSIQKRYNGYDSYGNLGIYFTVTYNYPDTEVITLTGSTIPWSSLFSSITAYRVWADGSTSGWSNNQQGDAYVLVKVGSGTSTAICTFTTANDTYPVTWKNKATVTLSKKTENNTSALFNSRNRTERQVEVTLGVAGDIEAGDYDYGYQCYATINESLGLTKTFVLDAPPDVSTATVRSSSLNGIFWTADTQGLANSTILVSPITAQYQAYFSSRKLYLDDVEVLSDSKDSTNGAISIPITRASGIVAGTYTPRLVVTDTRGQVSEKTFDPITIQQYVPSTYDITEVQSSTASFFVNKSTASVTIDNIVCPTGYVLTEAKLIIGNDTVTQELDGTETSITLSVPLTETGTFTPEVYIRDSRRLGEHNYLSPITVYTYAQPTISAEAQRVTSLANPIDDDEGANVLLTANITVADSITISEPTVMVGSDTANVVWYETYVSDPDDPDFGLSDAIDWNSYSPTSPVTIYGFSDGYGSTTGYGIQDSFQIALTVEDVTSTAAQVMVTVPQAFFTVDFLAGGHGIAFGKPAVNVGFECGMDATFDETLTAQDMTAQEVQDFVDGVGGGTGAFADKVIEQGASGIWTYRKWASGIAECWGAISWAVTSWSTWGNLYYSTYSGTVNYPNGLFISAPILTSQSNASTNDNWLGSRAGSNYGNTKDHTNDFFLVRPTTGSTSMTAYAYAHAIGRWK